MGGEGGNGGAGRRPTSRRAQELVAIADESQRMGAGWFLIMLLGPIGIVGLGYLWVSVRRLRRIDELRGLRGWWLGVGVAATANFGVSMAAFVEVIRGAEGGAVPAELAVAFLLCAATAGVLTVGAWYLASREVGQPTDSRWVLAGASITGAVALAVFSAGAVWGSRVGRVSANVVNFSFAPQWSDVPLGYALMPVALLALWTFHRAQKRFRAGLQSTADEWARWENRVGETSS